MKKYVFWIACAAVTLILGCLLVQYLAILLKPYRVTDTTITVQQATTDNANMYQNNAYVDILCVNGRLYYFVNCWPGSLGLRSKFDGKLCTVEDGKINVLQKATLLYGNDNQFIYSQSEGQLVAYNTKSNCAEELASLPKNQTYDISLTPDGTLHLFAVNKGEDSYTIKDGILVEAYRCDFIPKQYELAGKRYFIQDTKILCQGEDISEQIGPASFRALIPYRDGLLLINDGYGSLVHYIQEDGTILPLFPEFACMCSTSSVNFYDNYIFVSFKRWESYDESGIGLKSFEGDGLEGTYRIDIKDMSIEKISDNIYNGMFVFDDSGIYACNREGDIHQIDFNGNVIQTIVD